MQVFELLDPSSRVKRQNRETALGWLCRLPASVQQPSIRLGLITDDC